MLSGPSWGSRRGSEYSHHVLSTPVLPFGPSSGHKGQNAGAVMNLAYLPWPQKAFPSHRLKVRVVVTEKRLGQGLGPQRRGGCTSSVPPSGSSEHLVRCACHSHQPLWNVLPALRESSPVTIHILQGGPFLLTGKLVQLLWGSFT